MKKQAGFTLFELIYVIGFLSVVGTVLYIVGHFINKFW